MIASNGECGFERSGDISAAGGLELVDPGSGGEQIVFGGRRSSSRNETGVEANEISAKRSSGFSEPKVCFNAALACPSFSLSMLDDVSSTRTRSRGASFAVSRSLGLIKSRK